MLWLVYMLFSDCLYVWTLKSIHYSTPVPQAGYCIGVILLAIFMTVIFITDKEKQSGKGVFILSLIHI